MSYEDLKTDGLGSERAEEGDRTEGISEMKLGFLIGALNPGGSERQLVYLASGMASRGHEVEVFCYDGPGEFDEVARERGVSLQLGQGESRLGKLLAVRRWARRFEPDVVHGFMKRASSLAVLASLPRRRFRVVATDFSTATYDPNQRALRWALRLFRFADGVATQTEVNQRNLIGLAPWLEGKVQVVRNGIDIRRFRPAPGRRPPGGPFVFLVVGTVWRAKNPVNLVRAAALLREKTERPFVVRWVGRRHRLGTREEIPEFSDAARLVESLGLEGVVQFEGPAERIEDTYHTADALLHVSIQDGIPNAVVEGMASGLPVVVSPVSDLPLIVEEGANGFVSEDFEAGGIADAMVKMLESSEEDHEVMGRRSRELAERWFGMERFVGEYGALYRSLLSGRV